jgi:hypothetical protein
MSKFKPFPELTVEPSDDETGEIIVRSTSGTVVFKTVEYQDEKDIFRLVDCWNACRKIFTPAAHLAATDEQITHLEQLRKEAWARAVELGANDFASDHEGEAA